MTDMTRAEETAQYAMKAAKYVRELEPRPYVVRWCGRTFSSDDTRDLALQVQAFEEARHD